jgi:translation initiation factor eIF-2B subunit gamma
MSLDPPCQAVILAGGGGSRLWPLTASGVPKVLLPVANRPLLSFPLRMLEEGGITDVLVVCEGEAAASAVRSWLPHHSGALRCEVARVQEGLPPVAALRAVLDRVRTESFVLLSGDVVTEAPLRAQLLAHHLRGAAVTALFGRRRTSPAADTPLGSAPRGVDYVGLAGADRDRLVFFAHSPGRLKELRLPAALLRQHPRVGVTTRLEDMQCWVLNTAVVGAVLEARPELRKLEGDLLPFLVRRQASPPAEVAAAAAQRAPSAGSSLGSALSLMALSDGEGGPGLGGAGGRGSPGAGLRRHAAAGWLCAAHVAPEGAYCQRANTLQGYADVNREAVAPAAAPRLLREAPTSRHDNFVAASAALGAKATVGAGCMVGADSSLGDRCSVKRSVLGRGCVVGAGAKVRAAGLGGAGRLGRGFGVLGSHSAAPAPATDVCLRALTLTLTLALKFPVPKVINSVLLEGVRVGEGAHIQNSVLCEGAVVREGAQVKDCRVGAGAEVAAGADLKGEDVCLTPPPPDAAAN